MLTLTETSEPSVLAMGNAVLIPFLGLLDTESQVLRYCMKLIDVRHIVRIRTAQERLRRHIYGDSGATFSKGKYMAIGSQIMGTITTFYSKDNLITEIYET